jgi:PilZ domain-containing protein
MLVAWQSGGDKVVSRVCTLGLGGLFISTPEPPPIGEVIKLFFEVPDGEVRARAVVRDSQPGKGMGIEFTAMGYEARARLNHLLKRILR